MCSGVPKVVPLHTCCPNIIISSSSLSLSKEFPQLEWILKITFLLMMKSICLATVLFTRISVSASSIHLNISKNAILDIFLVTKIIKRRINNYIPQRAQSI